MNYSSPVVAIWNLSQLLARKPTNHEILIVLGQTVVMDTPPRIAKHFPTVDYPIDNLNVFPAIGGGIWYLTGLGTSVPTGPLPSINLACPDGTGHLFSVYLDEETGRYTWWVEQSASGSSGTAITLTSTDLTRHQVYIHVDAETGRYTAYVEQSNALGAETPLTLFALDLTTHEITLELVDGYHVLKVEQ